MLGATRVGAVAGRLDLLLAVAGSFAPVVDLKEAHDVGAIVAELRGRHEIQNLAGLHRPAIAIAEDPHRFFPRSLPPAASGPRTFLGAVAGGNAVGEFAQYRTLGMAAFDRPRTALA